MRGREGTGSGALVLARSQQRAARGLSNFSRWQQIEQAVAALAVPRQGELAGLELPTGWGAAWACPGPRLCRMLSARGQWCHGCVNSSLQLSHGSESGEGKEGEKQLGQCVLVLPKGTGCHLGSLCCCGRDGELQREAVHCPPRKLREMDEQKMELGLCSREYWPGEELTQLGKDSQMGIHWDIAQWMAGREKRSCWPGGKFSWPAMVPWPHRVWG